MCTNYPHPQILAIPKYAMMEFAVPLMLAIQQMVNVFSLLIMTDAVMAINAQSTDVFLAQKDAHIPLSFVMMEMHVLLINVTNNLVNVSTPHVQYPILIFAQSKLVILRRVSSTLQRIVMMAFLALSIVAMFIVDALTLQTTLFVMTKTHVPQILAF
jgi:hypothetical protein